jgi:hypothetical protein
VQKLLLLPLDREQSMDRGGGAGGWRRSGDLGRRRAQVSKGKRGGAQGERDGAFTLDRGGRREGRRRHPWRPARAPMGGGAPVGSRRRKTAKRAELGALELLVGSVRPGVLPTGESATCRTGRRRRSVPVAKSGGAGVARTAAAGCAAGGRR